MNHSTTAAELAQLTATVAAGRAAETRRAALMRTARRDDPTYWTQVRLAQEAGISQSAVSKLLARPHRPALDTTDPASLIGRILGVADWIGARLQGQGECTRLTDKLIQGATPATAAAVGRLRTLIVKDLPALSGPERRTVKDALGEIDDLATEPLGATGLTQKEQTRMIMAMESQKHALFQAR